MILKAFTLGLSTGVFCLGYCYPILTPVMLSRGEDGKDERYKGPAVSLGLFLIGRLSAYMLFGGLIGIVGEWIRDSSFAQAYLIPSFFLLLGLIMILYGVIQRLPRWSLCQWANRFFHRLIFFFVLGFLAGINLCPPFLLSLSYVLSLGEVAKGILFFLFFFLATSIFVIPFVFSGLVAQFKNIRIAARISAIVAGGWFVYQAIDKIVMNLV